MESEWVLYNTKRAEESPLASVTKWNNLCSSVSETKTVLHELWTYTDCPGHIWVQMGTSSEIWEQILKHYLSGVAPVPDLKEFIK